MSPSSSKTALAIRMEGALEAFLEDGALFRRSTRLLERATGDDRARVVEAMKTAASGEGGFQVTSERLHTAEALALPAELRAIQQARTAHQQLKAVLRTWRADTPPTASLVDLWFKLHPELDTKLQWNAARRNLLRMKWMSWLHTGLLVIWLPVLGVLFSEGFWMPALLPPTVILVWIATAERGWVCPGCSGRHVGYRGSHCACLTCGLTAEEAAEALGGNQVWVLARCERRSKALREGRDAPE